MEPKRTSVEGRAEKKKKQMCRRIIDVAVELFERQGFNETTMEQIAEEKPCITTSQVKRL